MIARGLQELITFEIVDYRDFAKQHPGEFDRIISCEMVRARRDNLTSVAIVAAKASSVCVAVWKMKVLFSWLPAINHDCSTVVYTESWIRYGGSCTWYQVYRYFCFFLMGEKLTTYVCSTVEFTVEI